jgi:hypothetical protein
MITGDFELNMTRPMGAVTETSEPGIGALAVNETIPAGEASRIATRGETAVACQAAAGAPTIVPVVRAGDADEKVVVAADVTISLSDPTARPGAVEDIVSNAGGLVTLLDLSRIGATDA